MKKRLVTIVLAVLVCFAVGYVGYVVGATRGGPRAARSANTDSLVYFRSIHEKLAAKEYDRAKDVAEMAVDGHIGLLRLLDTTPNSRLFYAWPWAAVGSATEARQKSLRETSEYFLALPGALKPQTREFLTALSFAGPEE
ncbi:MAG: hypothetical protein HN976_07950 [Lentisphaerae bacterium]|nr:hypothetical protein [Lentisphaerota bacterium]